MGLYNLFEYDGIRGFVAKVESREKPISENRALAILGQVKATAVSPSLLLSQWQRLGLSMRLACLVIYE